MNFCALCTLAVPQTTLREGEHCFCCIGCHTVYQILATQKALHNYQSHPIFHQAMQAGLISNPTFLEEIRSRQPATNEGEWVKFHLEIHEMWCPSCAEVIKLILLQKRGIRGCTIDYTTDLAAIEYSPRYLCKEEICETIQKLGYRPATLGNEETQAVSKTLYLQFAIAAFCALNLMMFAYPIYASYFFSEEEGYSKLFGWLSLGSSLPLFYSAWPIFRRFFYSLVTGIFGMETLVFIGFTAAFCLSFYEVLQGSQWIYFDSMAVTIALVLLGKILENRAKFSAKESLLRLTRTLPKRGRKQFLDGSQKYVSIKEIQSGDCLMVLAGEKIILDGIVIEGSGSCSEALMTGEPFPVDKQKGSQVLGGSLLQQGWLLIHVTATQEQSALQRIIEMVEQEVTHKLIYKRITDRIVSWFVPFVLCLAIGIALLCVTLSLTDLGKTVLQTAVIRAVSVLLIACPCAIGIAVPLAESYLMHRLAALGVIVRNRGCLSHLGKETAFVFDKTGTATKGKFIILSGLEALSPAERRMLRGLALKSIHPIAIAVADSIQEEAYPFVDTEEFVGKGMRGCFEGKSICMGSRGFLQELGMNVPEETPYSSAIVSYVYVAIEQNYATTLLLGDQIQPGMPELITQLAPLPAYLLSGDSQQAVEAVAQTCGFTDCRWGYTPLQKRDFVDHLRQEGHVVCFLGDGINDAPSLAGAHVGISVLKASDVSIEVSDIMLTTERLQVVPKMRSLATKSRKIMQQNLFWAFAYNIVGIGLACLGVLSPLFAAFAMTASSLMVLFNSRRLL